MNRLLTTLALTVVFGFALIPAPAAPGALISYWNYNDASNLGFDACNSYQGTMIGGTAGPAVPGVGGTGSLSLSGAAQYMKLDQSTWLNFPPGEAFSFSAWVKGSNQDTTILGKMRQGSGYTGYELHVGSVGPGLLNVWLINNYGTAYIQVNGTTNVLDNQWHQVAMTYDGTGSAAGVKIYVDGANDTGAIIANSLGANTLESTALFNIGSRSSGTAHNYTGLIDEVAYWDQVLTPAQVADVHNLGVTAPVYPLSIDVPNGSFETPATATYTGTVAAWNGGGSRGIFNNAAGYGSAIVNTDGSQLAYMNTVPGSMLFQEIGARYLPGQSYTLTVGLAARSDRPAPGSQMEIRYYYRNDPYNTGSTPYILGSTVVSYEQIGNTALTDFTVTLPAVQPTDAWANKPIGIWLVSTVQGQNGDWSIDNVRLTAVPEPASWLSAAAGLLGLWVLRRRRAV